MTSPDSIYEEDQSTVALHESEGCLLLCNFLLLSVGDCEDQKLAQANTKYCWKIRICCQTFYFFLNWISLVYKPRKGALLSLPALLPTFKCTQFILGIYNTVYFSLTTLMIFQILFFLCFFPARLFFPKIQRQ